MTEPVTSPLSSEDKDEAMRLLLRVVTTLKEVADRHQAVLVSIKDTLIQHQKQLKSHKATLRFLGDKVHGED